MSTKNLDYIYAIHNKISDKYYVGKSARAEHRIYDHIKLLRRNAHSVEGMQNDFNKYGEDSFVTYVVPFPFSLARTNIEGKTMLLLRSYKEEYGYNYKDPFVIKKDGTPSINVKKYEKKGEEQIRLARNTATYFLNNQDSCGMYEYLCNLILLFVGDCKNDNYVLRNHLERNEPSFASRVYHRKE